MQQIQKLVRGIKWDQSVAHGPYAVIPIIGELDNQLIDVEIVNDTTEGVEVSELQKEDVNRVQIKSKYKNPLLIMNGQIFEGGRQTRSSIRPFVIENGRKSEIPVNCVEQGRWVYTQADGSKSTRDFKFSRSHLSSHSKSFVSSHRANQSSTWNSISERSHRYHLDLNDATTQNYLDMDLKVRAKNEEQINEIRKLVKPAFEHSKQRGIIIMKNNEIISCEIFASTSHWEDVSNTLLESNVLEFIPDDNDGENITNNIPKISDIEVIEVNPLVDEQSYKIVARGLEGWAVGYDDKILYSSFYKPVEFNKESHF